MMEMLLIMLMVVINTAAASAPGSTVNIKPRLETSLAKRTLHSCYQLQLEATEIPSNISNNIECM